MIAIRDVEHNYSGTKDQFLLKRKDADFTFSSKEIYPFQNLSDIAGLTAIVNAQIAKDTNSSDPELGLNGEANEYTIT